MHLIQFSTKKQSMSDDSKSQKQQYRDFISFLTLPQELESDKQRRLQELEDRSYFENINADSMDLDDSDGGTTAAAAETETPRTRTRTRMLMLSVDEFNYIMSFIDDTMPFKEKFKNIGLVCTKWLEYVTFLSSRYDLRFTGDHMLESSSGQKLEHFLSQYVLHKMNTRVDIEHFAMCVRSARSDWKYVLRNHHLTLLISARGKSLKSLRLEGQHMITRNGLEQLKRLGNSLEKLVLLDLCHLNTEVMVDLLASLRSLKSLDIQIEGNNEDIVKALTRSKDMAPALERLRLDLRSGTRASSDDLQTSIASGTATKRPFVKYLELWGGIGYLVSLVSAAFPGVEELHLRSAGSLSDMFNIFPHARNQTFESLHPADIVNRLAELQNFRILVLECFDMKSRRRDVHPIVATTTDVKLPPALQEIRIMDPISWKYLIELMDLLRAFTGRVIVQVPQNEVDEGGRPRESHDSDISIRHMDLEPQTKLGGTELYDAKDVLRYYYDHVGMSRFGNEFLWERRALERILGVPGQPGTVPPPYRTQASTQTQQQQIQLMHLQRLQRLQQRQAQDTAAAARTPQQAPARAHPAPGSTIPQMPRIRFRDPIHHQTAAAADPTQQGTGGPGPADAGAASAATGGAQQQLWDMAEYLDDFLFDDIDDDDDFFALPTHGAGPAAGTTNVPTRSRWLHNRMIDSDDDDMVDDDYQGTLRLPFRRNTNDE